LYAQRRPELAVTRPGQHMKTESHFILGIDLERCVGHGRCYDLAPALFAPADDEGRARIVADPIGGNQLELARLAVNSCPEEAITLTDSDEPSAMKRSKGS
jgi:ferredoxin